VIIIPSGHYYYEITINGELTAVEEAWVRPGSLTARRESAANKAAYEVEAAVDNSGFVYRIQLRYRHGPFARSARYDVIDDVMQGSIRTLSTTSSAQVQLGRFREVDADLTICKTLIVAHLRRREQRQWTGKVALIDSTTLLARAVKQSYAQTDAVGLTWLFEPTMGERETLEFDHSDRLLRARDQRGFEAKLRSADGRSA
jgi:hypothetical protein